MMNVSPSSTPTRTLRGISLALALAVALPGCGGGEPSASDSEASTIVIDGSSTVFRISKAAQQKYNAVAPDVTVIVDNHGTGGGFSRYIQGEVDIVDASRPAKDDETKKAQEAGLGWTRFVVGYDGITVVANPKNDFVKSLGVDQLKALWSPGSAIKTWKDLDPSWPARPIVLYSPDNDSGTFEFFVEAVVRKKAQREDVQQSKDDTILVSGIAGDVDGLGYFGYAYFAANAAKLRAIPVQNGPDAAPVAPSPATILDKSYTPLSRPLFIYVKNTSLRRTAVQAFVKYYLANIKDLSETGGYVPPTAEDLAANQKAFDEAISVASTASR
jgi:phosphate transport system substrate-binding protein